jgi:hypothetical protein
VTILYLTNDLLFSSRVTAAAKQVGVRLAVIGSLEQLRERLDAPTPAVLIDLEHREADAATIKGLLQDLSPRPTMIAYGPHVKDTLLQRAQAAGFDLVLSRGQFDQQIGQLLQSWAPTQ